MHEGVADMTTRSQGALLYLGKPEAEASDHDLFQGLVCMRSFRSPDKETPNEDSAAIIPMGSKALVLAVADGVGGTPAGRDASNEAVKTLTKVLAKADPSPENLRATVIDAVEAANRGVLELSRGAATTLVVGVIMGGQVRSYHVGDSELFSVGQRGRMKLRITPHSPTGFAVEAGLMDEDEAVRHDQRHILFNVIGAPDMRIEIGAPTKLDRFDTVLLASDGLLDNLYVDEIVDIIRAGPLSAAADQLVNQARKRMATDGNRNPSKPDDLTLVLFRPHAAKTKK